MIRGVARKFFEVKHAYFAINMDYTDSLISELNVDIVKNIIR